MIRPVCDIYTTKIVLVIEFYAFLKGILRHARVTERPMLLTIKHLYQASLPSIRVLPRVDAGENDIP